MNDLPRIQALRCFITVAREGTVSRAAHLLHLTQPAARRHALHGGLAKSPLCTASIPRANKKTMTTQFTFSPMTTQSFVR